MKRLLADALVVSSPLFSQLRPEEIYWPGKLELHDIAALEFYQAADAWNGRNITGAIKLFGKSAQKGNNVGEYCFRSGQYHELFPPDFAQAMKWYKRGVRVGHRGSTTSLGKLLVAFGNHSEGKQLLKTSALASQGDQGDSLAQWLLAELSLSSGAVRDAVRWWKRSAENGDKDAMMRLAAVFAQGTHGVPQEEARSDHWFLASAVHGHPKAFSTIVWPKSSYGDSQVQRYWFHVMESLGWF